MTPLSTQTDARFSSQGPNGSSESGLGLQKIFVFRMRMLWDERRLLLRATSIGILVGFILAFIIPVQYESSVELMPPDNRSTSGLAMAAALAGGAGAFAPIAGDVLGLKSSGDQFVGILHSRTAEDDLIQRFDLNKVYGTTLEDDARKKLAERTQFVVDRKSGIITITVQDHDPRRAAAIAQGYVNELDHLVATLSTSAAHRERVFLEDRLKSVKQDLDQAATDLSQFASKNTTIDPTEQGKTMVQAAASLQGEMIAAKSELKGLEQIYSTNNVRVRSVQARIAELQQQLGKLGGSGVGSSDTISDIETYPSIRELPILGMKYSDLYRRTKIQEAVYESLTKEYELAKVEEAKETPSVKVLDPANVPERKSFPPRTLITLLCALSMLAGASVWVFVARHWRRTESDDPAKVLAQEVIRSLSAKMPWAPPNGSRWQAATHKVWSNLVRRSDQPLDRED